MKVKGVLAFILTVFTTGIIYAQTPGKLKKAVEILLAEQNLCGAVWTIVNEKGEIITDAAGFKNAKTREPLNPDNKMQVGSVAKTILAAAVLRMASSGLLNLDDAIKNYLPGIPIKNQWNATNPVTIRHLLDHTSGLADAKLWHVFSTTASADTPLETVYLNSPGLLHVQSKPGSVYSYSNLGYSILGMLIEKITHQRYEHYLDENLLKPLGMSNSSFHFIAQEGPNADKQLAYGHFDNNEPVVAMPMYLRPAGQLTTTGEDIGKFLRFMMSDGKINNTQFINIEYLAAVGQPKMTDAYKAGVTVGDALGAYSRDRYGVTGLAKNGNTLGFSAMLYMFPQQQKAFFIAHNMDSETANYDLFNKLLVSHLNLTTQPLISTKQTTGKEIANWNGFYIPVITKVQPFGLIDYIFSHTKVETNGTGAILKPFQGKSRELIYQGNNLFSMNDRTTISHSFYTSSDGELYITDGVKTLKKVHGIKMLGIVVSLSVGILGLIYLLVSGCGQLLKHRDDFKNQPFIGFLISLLVLLAAAAFILNQSFMQMGDKTVGNLLLALATLLLPLSTVLSLILIIKQRRYYWRSLSFWAIVSFAQCCFLLITHGLMPIIMWR